MNVNYLDAVRFPVVHENGVVAECEALLAFDEPLLNKSFLVYTDNSTDASGALTLFASSYRMGALQPGAGGLSNVELLPLENAAEQRLVEAALDVALGH